MPGVHYILVLFYFQIDVPIINFISVKNHLEMSFFIENWEIRKNLDIFGIDLGILFRGFAILIMHFLGKFRPYISVFGKDTIFDFVGL